MSRAEDKTPIKRRRVEKVKCVICEKQCSVDALVKVRDLDSWRKLHEAATTRHFDPILRIAGANPKILPDVQYHRDCRSKFTHYKNIRNLQAAPDNSENVPGQRKSARQLTQEDKPRVYPEICIFCEQKTKYIKGTHTRERLIKATELRADKTIREIAVSHCDERILAITSRDVVAAEAHYHALCYRLYTKPARESTCADSTGDDYRKAEGVALGELYSYVRANIFSNPCLISLIDLTEKLESFLSEQGVQVKESTKKHLRRNLDAEFGETLHFFTTDRRVYVRLHTLTTDAVASDVIRLEKQIKLYNEGQHCDELIEKEAVIIRNSIRNSITKEQTWPPHPRELDESYVELPERLMTFLNVLLGGSESYVSDRTNRFSWSFAQDIVHVVTNAQVITPKHVLLSYVVKTLTGN